MATRYQIIDEPAPSQLSNVIVNPFWPLLGLMLGGAWLAWPWFLLNGHALNSATRRREHTLLGIALGGSIVLAFIAGAAAGTNSALDFKLFSYALLLVRAFKSAMGYLLFLEQQKSFQIHETFGGKTQAAGIVIAVAYGVRQLIGALVDNLVLLIILL